MSNRWFRFYSEAMRNPKIAKLNDKQFRLWVQLLSIASENNGKIPALDDLKHILNKRLDHLLTGVKELLKGGLIVELADGYEPNDWQEYQYKSDSSKERVRKHRSKCNVTVTAPDTEAEKEKKKIYKKEKSRPFPVGWKPKPFSKGTASKNIIENWTDQRRASEVELFETHHKEKGNEFVDWQGAWSTWVIRSEKYNPTILQPVIPI